MIATVFAISALATIPATAATTAAPTQTSTYHPWYVTNPGFELDANKAMLDAKKTIADAMKTIADAKKTMPGTDPANGRTFNYPEAAMNSKLRGGSHLATDSSPERRLNSRCKSKDAKWIENSSMELNGPGWHGTVNGGSYHCGLSLAGGLYKYRVDCVKTGGSNTDFFFNDGDDRYGLYMKTNGNHVVHYNGKAPIIAVGVCSDATVSTTGRKLENTALPQTDALHQRRLNSRCKSKDAKWIENSSMELNGPGWHGTVNGGSYHCGLSLAGGLYKYRVDCVKTGGSNTDFFFNDGDDRYGLYMKTNGNHVVHYNGKAPIIAVGVCSDATVSTTGRKLAVADSSPERRLQHVSIPNSSMELNGAGWHGTVSGGNYHCRLVKSKSWIYDYQVDCEKSGGDPTLFYFNDGSDTYALGMSSDTHHTVSYNGNPRIVAISYSDNFL